MTSSKRIVSYCDPLSTETGDEVRFMVSSLDSEAFDTQLVRLICGDISPGGHGYEEVECESDLNGRYDGKPRFDCLANSEVHLQPTAISR